MLSAIIVRIMLSKAHKESESFIQSSILINELVVNSTN